MADFARGEVRATRGEEFPGGRMEVTYPADESVKIDFDFRKGGRYVGVFLPEIGEGAICLSGDIRVTCEVPCGILFSARDAKGDSYCAWIKPERAGEWSPFAVPLTKLCWCGGKSTNEVDRARIKWPLRSARISCEPKKTGHTGSFEMRRPRLKTTASEGFDRWTFSLKPPRFGSLYLPDETIVLPYRLHRLDESADAVMPMRIERVELTDRLGRQVHARALQEEGGALRLQAGDLGNSFGSFKATFYGRSTDGKSVELGHTWFARLTGRSRPVAWCGTGVHGWGREQLKCYDLMETVGIGTVRNEPLWSSCERQKGVYTVPELFGAHIDAMRRRGISLNMILNYGNTLYEDPVDVTAFCKWARHLVTHEARDVNAFEIWNEAWNTEFGKLYGKAGDDTFFGKFVSFSQQVTDMLHDARPEATVAVAVEDTIHGLTNMLARNIARSCDVVSFHPYVHKRDPRPERLDFFFADDGAFLRQFAAQNGGAWRFRISEVGWSTYTVDEKGRSKQSFGGYPSVTLAEQADYLIRAYLLARSFGVESTMQYDFHDDGPNRHYTEDNFGVVFGDYTPKPSLAAIAFMTRTLGNAAPLGEFGNDRTAARLLGFEGLDGRRRYVGWAVEAPTEVALPDTSEPLRAFDLMGNPLAPEACGKTVRLTESPVYFLLAEKADTAARQSFGSARWMWPESLGTVTNTVVEFRTTFRAEKATPLEMSVAADTVFAVELNGAFVHSGRFPDVPPQRYFDTRQIGTARAGENELLVRLYVQGAKSFQTIPGDPGLMFAVTGEGVRVESGAGVEWRVSAGDRRDGVPMVTEQLGFSFEYDAAAPAASWRKIGEDDARRGCDAFDLSRRPVPPVEILPPADFKVIAQGALDGSPVPEKVAPGMDKTVMTPMSADRLFLPDGKGVRSEMFEKGFYYLIDLGREEAGLLTLDVETDAGVVIDIGHAEHSENGRITVRIGGRNFAGRYHCREGRQQYCRWARRMAGRYIQLHVRGARTRFALHGVTVRPTLYPVDERPAPSGLSDLRRKIWDVSVRTLRLCMHEHYEDCPWREQSLYGNDARNQMLCGYYAFAPNNRMPELALRVHARGINDDGWQTMCMPAQISLVIPSFTFCWVLAVDDNLRHRGDHAFIRTMMPAVRKVLETHLREMREGLLPCPAGSRYWQFYEWSTDMDGSLCGPDYVKPGEWRYESPLNLFFVLALEAGARCADAAGDAPTAVRWRAAANGLRAEIGRRFWNKERGCLEMRLGKALRPSEFTQSLALIADVVPADARAEMVRKLAEGSDWTEITLSQTLYKYQALLAAGGKAAASVVLKMDAEWKRMLDAGATSFWEMREGWPAFGNAGSLCHGWSAIPVYIYGAYPNLLK